MKLLDETSDLTEKRPSVAVVNEKESVLQGFSIGADTRASMADINAQLVVLRGAPRKGYWLKERGERSKSIQELIVPRTDTRDERHQAEQEYVTYLNELRRAQRQKQEITVALNLFDTVGSEEVDTNERKVAMHMLCLEPTNEEIQKMISNVGDCNSDTIGGEEFLKMMTVEVWNRDPLAGIKGTHPRHDQRARTSRESQSIL